MWTRRCDCRCGSRLVYYLDCVACSVNNADKTHCKEGHELTGINLYLAPRTHRQSTRRVCRACQALRRRVYWKERNVPDIFTQLRVSEPYQPDTREHAGLNFGANCVGFDTEMWALPNVTDTARAICEGCPIRRACHDDAKARNNLDYYRGYPFLRSCTYCQAPLKSQTDPHCGDEKCCRTAAERVVAVKALYLEQRKLEERARDLRYAATAKCRAKKREVS